MNHNQNIRNHYEMGIVCVHVPSCEQEIQYTSGFILDCREALFISNDVGTPRSARVKACYLP